MTAIACGQPGCSGSVEDGYCNLCGMAPTARRVTTAPTAKPAAAAAAVAGTGGDGASARSVTSTRSTGSRRTTGRTRTSTRGHIGAGLVDVPEIPVPDPLAVVMTNPEVAEEKRFCASCGEPVGRSRAGRRGRSDGFCGKCRNAFSFSPKLVSGQLIGGQYAVVGCLAHGGLGWIYLARDTHVSDRWVVLKGLLDSGDEEAMVAAVAERRFLATVEHPNIVKIYNFVEHDGAGYTVMEYVGGTSLKAVLKERKAANGGKAAPLPVAQAIAYVLEILPALGYLHKQGLVYCDFKPDNVVLQGDSLKLIDLGGVRRLDDPDGAIYGTVGFQGPEISELGPSVASDLYTVARTLAVLILDFRGYQGAHKFSLPDPASEPVLAASDSLVRLLAKATRAHPDDRFTSPEEMGEQLLGVLREIVALEEGTPRPAASSLFTGDRWIATDHREGNAEDDADGDGRTDWTMLPGLKVADDDPAAGLLANLPTLGPDDIVPLLQAAVPQTVEVRLRLARAHIERGDHAGAEQVLGPIAQEDPWEWRVDWYRGMAALAGPRDGAPDPVTARSHLDRVVGEVPGELAPKLALATATEAAADIAGAARGFEVVVRTDPGFTLASFGLARCLTAAGNRRGAVDAYRRVPMTSIAYVEAQVRAARLLVSGIGSARPGPAQLVEASIVIERLALDAEQRAQLARDVLASALDLLRVGGVAPSTSMRVMGRSLEEQQVRLGLEHSYRELARLAATGDERIRLIDLANSVRPRTLV